MDCNSYSYTAPGFGTDSPAPHRQTVNSITIQRREHNGHTYYIIRDGNPDPVSAWSNKTYTLDDAARTMINYFKNGI